MLTINVARKAFAGALVCLLGACSKLTDATAPGLVEPSAEDNAVGAVARYAGAVRAMTGALSGTMSTGSLFTDEMLLGDFAGNGPDTRIDARRQQTLAFQTGYDFTSIMSARVNTIRSIDALRTYAPTPSARLGRLYALMGFAELYLAEVFCNGIPFSTIDDAGNVTYGGPVGTTAIYNMAIAHFDTALSISGDSARIMNLARIGKGRGLLQLGRYADAAAAVTAVPTSFVFQLDINSNTSLGQYNRFWYGGVASTEMFRVVSGGSEGGNGINWVAANDPRVPLVNRGLARDRATPAYFPTFVTSYGTAQPLTSGVEARLIEAEAALQANKNDAATTGTGWLGILNDLRANAAAPNTGVVVRLAALSDPGSFDKRVDLLFRESAFWTYLQGTRFGSLRRLVRQYNRAQNTVWPTGTFKDGVPYGDDVVLEPPYGEAPNKNWTGCTDRKA